MERKNSWWRKVKKDEMERCPFLIPQDKKLIDSQKSRLTKIFNQEKNKSKFK